MSDQRDATARPRTRAVKLRLAAARATRRGSLERAHKLLSCALDATARSFGCRDGAELGLQLLGIRCDARGIEVPR
jgi:hypothetical protein